MNPNDSKQPKQGSKTDSERPAGQTDPSFTPPHGDPEKRHIAAESEAELVSDPKNPASKPQGTLQDQVQNMENEGQAQDSSPELPPDSDDKSE